MMDIMLCGQLKDLYISYMVMKPTDDPMDYSCKAGDMIVTITANQRNNR